MFIAAKLLAFLTQPLAWVALLLLAALWVRPSRRNRLVSAALALLLIAGWEPLPDALLRGLENQHAPLPPTTPLQGYQGVLVLGGALEPGYVWTAPGQAALNDAAERMTEVLPLLRRQPTLKVLFSGGDGNLIPTGPSEAERARLFFTQQGLPPAALWFESASRTTYENALLSKALPQVDATRPWLLLTSASHMPRAMATFRATGWNVTAYPVDFRAGQHTPWSEYSMDQGVKKWRTGLHEWLGLLAYRLSGRA